MWKKQIHTYVGTKNKTVITIFLLISIINYPNRSILSPNLISLLTNPFAVSTANTKTEIFLKSLQQRPINFLDSTFFLLTILKHYFYTYGKNIIIILVLSINFIFLSFSSLKF